jgi:hypothetical protein
MKLFRHLTNLLGILALPREARRVVFYSEGKNYWIYLQSLIEAILKNSDIPVCYISSDEHDPGLQLKHNRFRSFETNEGFIRNWLFENIETDVLIMTMPDINSFQIKRSHHKAHYIYVQHSLVSLHMAYRESAFSHFDTIFCAGPHHANEVRALEALHNLPEKSIVEHGYSRIESLINKAKNFTEKEKELHHVLVSPSWGPSGIIESGNGLSIVQQLISAGLKVTLRPHPQTIKFANSQVMEIVSQLTGNSNFNFEANVTGQESLLESDIMISDWSGSALDYAFGLNKPVLFMDVPRKVNNPNYEKIPLTPIEVSIREKIGDIAQPGADNIVAKVKECYNKTMPPDLLTNIYNIGKSGEVGAAYIIELAQTLYKKDGVGTEDCGFLC